MRHASPPTVHTVIMKNIFISLFTCMRCSWGCFSLKWNSKEHLLWQRYYLIDLCTTHAVCIFIIMNCLHLLANTDSCLACANVVDLFCRFSRSCQVKSNNALLVFWSLAVFVVMSFHGAYIRMLLSRQNYLIRRNFCAYQFSRTLEMSVFHEDLDFH